MAVAAAGAALALTVVLGVTNAGVMLALWAIQLSLYGVGQVFWGFGWEIQLLETGMLAAVLCPMRSWRPLASAPPTVAVWLLRWLIVRVMLGAGLIKLRGDPCWRELTCLVTHYETQPNPSPMSWLFHQLPHWAHVAGVLFNHLVEIRTSTRSSRRTGFVERGSFVHHDDRVRRELQSPRGRSESERRPARTC